MQTKKYKLKKLIPLLLILTLLGLNLFAYNMTKSYFSNAGVQEVEELTDAEQGENNSFKLLSWTYELFKSFSNPDKK